MKNAKVKGKDGKPPKKLRVAKFNFCTVGMPFPFRNNMPVYDYRPPMNNMISFSKNANSDFVAYNMNRNLQSPTSPQQSSPVSVISVQQPSSMSTSFIPAQFIAKERNQEIESRSMIKHRYYNNIQPPNNFTDTNKINDNIQQSEGNLSSYQNNNTQDHISNINSQKEEFLTDDSRKNIENSSFRFPHSNISEINSFQDIIPSSFDIVKRGPLPSIMLKTNGKIEFSDL